jgi:hypothetical protein
LPYRSRKIPFFSCKNTAFTPYISPDAAGHDKEWLGNLSLPGRGGSETFGLTADAIKEAIPSFVSCLQGRGLMIKEMRAPHAHDQDGTQTYFKDWGKGQPVVFSHGCQLAFEDFQNGT